ncbi:MAG: GC-type dockerin domain-anchored protein [Phycisphaerales bacterium JB052]
MSGQASAQTVIDFDGGVIGGVMTSIGDEPMYHYRDHVVYGSPSVSDLSDIYPMAHSVVVHPASRWRGLDIVPIFNNTSKNLDIWFGDPFDGGELVRYALSTGAGNDLMIADPIEGFSFKVKRLFVVGERMVAYCSVFEDAVQRENKIAILSASMEDLQSVSEDPWTVHFVSAEYSSRADQCGGLWPISIPQFYEGYYWSVVTDYDSGLYEGGQCWLLCMEEDGTPKSMVRMHTRSGQVAEHWHGGTVLRDEDGYKVVWHLGDRVTRLFYREIETLSDAASMAQVDPGSGVGGAYQTLLASEDVWGPITLAGGPDEDTALQNSRWKNAFILAQDPHDETKFLYGGDVSAGLVSRVSIDAYGVAECETVFDPISRNVRQQQGEVTRHLSTFMVATMGSTLVGIVSNEFNFGSNVPQYSGIIQSDDGGQTWGWIWRGSTEAGLVQNSGVAVLSNGRVIAGMLNEASTVIGITPGTKLSGVPLYVGYRPENLLGDAFEQMVLNDGSGGGGLVSSSGSSPEKPLPPIVHTEAVFDLHRVEGSGGGASLRLIEGGVYQSVLSPVGDSSNMNVAFWTRRKTPESSEEADRMVVDTRFGWATPGGSYGTSVQRYTPTLKMTTNDWVRVIGQYDGSHVSGVFDPDPGDLRASIRGSGLATSTSRSEVLFEYVSIGHDRPALPYVEFDRSGVSSAKFTGLGLGDTWTVLVALQVPEEAWDSWSGNESDTWEEPVPVLTISDAADAVFASLDAHLVLSARGGVGTSFANAVFNWELRDSQDSIPTEVSDHPVRTMGVVIALSKDGEGKLSYAIGGPQGITSGSRTMSERLNLDTLRFSDLDETDALEMYIHQIQADCHAYSIAELETVVSTLDLPGAGSGSCSCVADFTGDGALDFFDVSAFLIAYTGGDSSADLNDDGQFSFFDVSMFLQAFGAGCD